MLATSTSRGPTIHAYDDFGISYKNSSWGWDREMKRKQLSQDCMEYLFLLARNSGAAEDHPLTGVLLAFAAVVPGSSEVDVRGRDRPVAYLYELQVAESLRGAGCGSLLLSQVEAMAKGEPSRPKLIMLTCFTANKRAIRFYQEKNGFTIDEISPGPGEADYLILSKPLG